MDSTREIIAREIEQAAVKATEALDAERRKMAHIPKNNTIARRSQALKIQAAAFEQERCLKALFQTDGSRR